MLEFHINKTYGDPRKFGDISLFQLGRLIGTKETRIPLHFQIDYFELTIITSGSGTIITNGVESQVKTGDIYLSLPFETHQIQSSKETPIAFDFFTFKTSNPEYTEKLEQISYYLRDPENRIFIDQKINFLISNAILEIENENDYSKKILENIFNQVIMYLIRETLSGRMNSKDDTHKSRADILCIKIMNYIDTHVSSIKSLTELTSLTNYNYSYISSLFKQKTGITLNRYLQNKKLESAKFLLRNQNLKIIDIAEILNYSSLYSFSKAFKEKFGTSPKTYKNSKR